MDATNTQKVLILFTDTPMGVVAFGTLLLGALYVVEKLKK